MADLMVKLYGGLLPVARRKEHARPLMLWLIARATDHAGSGVVDQNELHIAAAPYITRATFYRTINTGARLGFWTIIDRASGSRVLVLTGLEALAAAQNIPNVGSAPYVMSAARLVGAAAIRAAHYAALLACHATHTPTNTAINQAIGVLDQEIANSTTPEHIEAAEKLKRQLKAKRHHAAPISQRALTELGAPGRRTQSRYKRLIPRTYSDGGGIATKQNIARTGKSADHLTGTRENIHGGYFAYGGMMVRRLPNNYTTNLPRASASFTRKVNRNLGGLLECGDKAQADRAGAAPNLRLFYTSEKQAERAPTDLQFVRSNRTHRGARLWDEKRPEYAWNMA